MKTTEGERLKHGFTHPETGLRFWAYQNSGEYWVSKERYETLTKNALIKKRQRYHLDPNKFRNLSKEYRLKNREEVLSRARAYDLKRQKSPKRRQWIKKWASEYKNKNPSFATSVRLRIRLANAISSAKSRKAAPALEMLGCNWEKFMAHIESLFLPGMSWENRSQWHIDHIKPCCAFDLTKKEEQFACFHYTNLRPLWAKDNLIKNGKY